MVMRNSEQIFAKVEKDELHGAIRFAAEVRAYVEARLPPGASERERMALEGEAYSRLQKSADAGCWTRANSRWLGDDAAAAFRDAKAIALGRMPITDPSISPRTVEMVKGAGILGESDLRKLGRERIEKGDEVTETPSPEERLRKVAESDRGLPWQHLLVERRGVRQFGLDHFQSLAAFRNGDLPHEEFVVSWAGRPVSESAVDWQGFDDSLRARGLSSSSAIFVKPK